MALKGKFIDTSENPMVLSPIDLGHFPLEDKDLNFAYSKCDFNLFELHYWMKDIFLDQSDENGL
jgi:hypothetical protein